MKTYRHTIYASYLGYVTQAIINNLAPMLFLIFRSEFGIPLEKITILITANFLVQLIVDLISAKFADRIGYRPCIMAAHVFAAIGLVGLVVFPMLFANDFLGLLLAVILYAVGGGIIEVLVSPIVEACPTDNKAAVMGLLHSFYCWGAMAVILLTTLFFALAGKDSWRWLPCLWALVPALNVIYFSFVPIARLTEENEGMTIKELCVSKLFWVLILLMFAAGAADISINQWASALAESGLGVSKTVGDIAGPCFVAAMMGVSRVLYAKFSAKVDMLSYLIGSSILCAVSYLLVALSPIPALSLVGCGLCGLSVGIMWPGVFSVASERCPKGGTALFALLALAGDAGGTGGPTLVGMIASVFGENLKIGIGFTVIFPLLLIGAAVICRRMGKQKHFEKNVDICKK